MSEIGEWSRSASGNAQPIPDGWPEGMKRSAVNDAAREDRAVLRRYYEDPHWLDLLDEDDGYTVSRIDDDTINVVHNSTPTNASQKFPVGARVRIGDGATFVYGFVSAVNFVTPNTIVDLSMDGASVVQAGADSAEIFAGKDAIGTAAFSDVGIATGQFPPEVPSIDDLGDGATLDQGDGNGFDADQIDGYEATEFFDAAAVDEQGLVINGDFSVWQRGSVIDSTKAFPNDNGAYTADQWILLMGVGTGRPVAGMGVVDLSRITVGFPEGVAATACRITGNGNVASPTAEKVALVQFLERASCQHLRNQTVSLSFWARHGIGSAMGTIRAGLVEWVGTPDSLSSRDPVNDWMPAGMEPSMKTSFVLQAGAGVALTTVWQRFVLENVTLSGALANLGWMVWIDDTSWVSGDVCDLTGVSLVRGARAQTIAPLSPAAELARCERYCETTFDPDEEPRQNAGSVAVQALAGSNGAAVVPWPFRTSKFVTPTVVTYNPGAANANARNLTDGTDQAIASTAANRRVASFQLAAAGGNANDVMSVHATAEAVL